MQLWFISQSTYGGSAACGDGVVYTGAANIDTSHMVGHAAEHTVGRPTLAEGWPTLGVLCLVLVWYRAVLLPLT